MVPVAPFVIRPARRDEAGALSALALRSKAHWGYDEAFMAACRDELTLTEEAAADSFVAVTEEDGTVLGFTTLGGAPPEGELAMMFVEPHAMGRGVGRRLFAHVAAAARAAGFTRLTIDADPAAEPFYRAMGAVRIGSTPSGSIPGRTLPLLELTL
ncbi:GNAT family N-acetyltransferase [Actinacidiphila yeochonensis]|uniref:GNAT family N-acetyltransferase n=1 Tax=Actinacidiphila yeochonensis TaxID=89050 RepID=UPI001E3E1695|nr:GNAT family N-acetyltransferase [Actinacidiphila yeochonensis]